MQFQNKSVSSSRIFFPLLAAVAASVAGCGSNVDREDLSGAVTFAGKPVSYGSIEFVPDTAKGHSGPSGYADIMDGRYDTSLEGGMGVVVGPHRVQVTGYEEAPMAASENETLPSTSKPPLFFGFPIEADLEGGVKDFEVPESAKGYGVSGGQPRRRSNDP